MSNTTTNTKPTIPCLGDTPEAVLKAALNFDRAGFRLCFHVVCAGVWQFSPSQSTFEKCGKVNGVPVIERTEPGSFDFWLLQQIANGFVTITVEGSDFRKELHRATGSTLRKAHFLPS